ncbi:MAG: holo-[acyl-carrier-protein] synthase [Geobacteraceae bacterium GWC2_55_20]|nr:MAG: holo-[acyl-carrier-protein] synthase [Geobacteraceae bacterium GWC2_55_20]OGU25762.1 MAG: holo-[acyl-carrier-protein] synthase [Geobacteraceae bacterium GWF2_54_21]HBA72873.1 4'-phosphopantetheinyl transferase [Geobacter sp.]HCE66264.1 4'-phosphopantetheinyl transferase [Geobacter sp.]
MIHGIGVDIAATDRFQRFLDQGNNALLERLFTSAELSTCRNRKDAASCFAARFAAKEAFLKALGTGLRDGISWHDIEVVNDKLGKPELTLSGRAAELYQARGLRNALLSMSHDGGHAVAMVVLEVL